MVAQIQEYVGTENIKSTKKAVSVDEEVAATVPAESKQLIKVLSFVTGLN